MKEYTNSYYGKKTQDENGLWTVDLYNDEEIIETHVQVPSENIADAIIIPWVVQEGGTLMEKNDETDPVDPNDPLFERDFLK